MLAKFPPAPIIEASLTFKGHTNAVDTVCCVPANRNTVLSGSHDHLIKMWDCTSGKCVRDFQGHTYFYNTTLSF